jgi:hypothetical protein
MRRFFSENEQTIFAAGESQLSALNSRKWLERGTGRPATIRAVTIEAIAKLVRYFVANRAAQALAIQGTRTGRFKPAGHSEAISLVSSIAAQTFVGRP